MSTDLEIPKQPSGLLKSIVLTHCFSYHDLIYKTSVYPVSESGTEWDRELRES